jgi:hypothetical protein
MFDSFFAAMLHSISAEVAQLVEQPIRNRQVPGSSPGLGSIAILSDQLNVLRLQGMGAGRAVNVV